MFRFWSNDSRGSEKTAVECDYNPAQTTATIASESATAPRPLKRRRPSFASTASALHFTTQPSSTKRVKTEHYGGLPSPTSASADGEEEEMTSHENVPDLDTQRAEEVIQYQFGLEILLKHDELRLINQELAKCQIALEQLRRCHLIPYPVNCPTPEQMLNISAGKGPASQHRSGKETPKWAPPFGVVEGPYARHYAKWLIPDPVFGDLEPEVQSIPEALRVRTSAMEGRTTRNSSTDLGFNGKRLARGQGAQKLHALSSGYPQPKDKQSPCILKRADGQTVKLVCVDCHRWDFSSTQGFINHCRIAHRKEYKSHEEAAVHCGQPIEEEVGGGGGDEKPSAAPNCGLAHPFARDKDVMDQRTYAELQARLQASLELFKAGKHPYCTSLPTDATSLPRTPATPGTEVLSSTSTTTPYLSQLLQSKSFKGNLAEEVSEAKTKMNVDDAYSSDEDSEDEGEESAEPVGNPASPLLQSHGTARTPAVMRVPMRTDVTATSVSKTPSLGGSERSASADRESQSGLPQTADIANPLYGAMDVDLSPNTFASNIAPSLVSDDGEYDDDDDDDDGASSESNDDMDTGSVSDVAEINMDDTDETPRALHRRDSTSAAVKLKKDEAKHVTFVSPISSGNVQPKRKRKV